MTIVADHGHPRIMGRLVAQKLPDGGVNGLLTRQESAVATPARVRGVEQVQLAPIRLCPIGGLALRACGAARSPCNREWLS